MIICNVSRRIFTRCEAYHIHYDTRRTLRGIMASATFLPIILSVRSAEKDNRGEIFQFSRALRRKLALHQVLFYTRGTVEISFSEEPGEMERGIESDLRKRMYGFNNIFIRDSTRFLTNQMNRTQSVHAITRCADGRFVKRYRMRLILTRIRNEILELDVI